MKLKTLFLLLFCVVVGIAHAQEGVRFAPGQVLVGVNVEDDDDRIHLDLMEVGISLERIGNG